MNTIMSPETIIIKRADKQSHSALRKEIETVSQKCINCKLCQKECGFLRKYGKPKEIADSYNPV